MHVLNEVGLRAGILSILSCKLSFFKLSTAIPIIKGYKVSLTKNIGNCVQYTKESDILYFCIFQLLCFNVENSYFIHVINHSAVEVKICDYFYLVLQYKSNIQVNYCITDNDNNINKKFFMTNKWLDLIFVTENKYI